MRYFPIGSLAIAEQGREGGREGGRKGTREGWTYLEHRGTQEFIEEGGDGGVRGLKRSRLQRVTAAIFR